MSTRKTRKSTKKTRGGRPKGSTNIERPTVVMVPAACPRCGSTAQHHQPGYRPIVRRIDAGLSVVWNHVVCEACGQHYRVRSEQRSDPSEKPTD